METTGYAKLNVSTDCAGFQWLIGFCKAVLVHIIHGKLDRSPTSTEEVQKYFWDLEGSISLSTQTGSTTSTLSPYCPAKCLLERQNTVVTLYIIFFALFTVSELNIIR